jgi:hypothetical protein
VRSFLLLREKGTGNMTPEQIQQALTESGWVLDGSYYEYLIVGHDDHLSILAHRWVWEQDRDVFELSDERTERVYWVHAAIPTPWQAKLLLDEHGDSPEEEPQRRNLYELGQHG